MFRFEHIQYLWLLVGVLLFTILFIWYWWWAAKKSAQFGEQHLIEKLTPYRSKKLLLAKFVLSVLAYVFVVLGFANPQIGTRQEKVTRKGIDVIMALDVSNSMLSEDLKPNRLLRAKNFIQNFLNQLHNDRLGIIVFAGRAYLQMPLTVDYSAARMYIKTISPAMIPTQGTNIAEAINLARESFVAGETKSKALIVITDGEDNEGGVDEALENAVKEGIKVYTIGIGTDNGGPIPVGNDYKRDGDGNIVLTKMNKEMMRDIASKGKGKFYQLDSGKDDIESLLKELGGISSKEFEEYVFTDFDDQFQWCLAIAAVLLLLEWWISNRSFAGLRKQATL